MERSKPARSSSKVNKAEVIELAKATAQSLLEAVVEFSDAFPPLKTAAAAVQFVVDRVEVSFREFEVMWVMCLKCH